MLNACGEVSPRSFVHLCPLPTRQSNNWCPQCSSSFLLGSILRQGGPFRLSHEAHNKTSFRQQGLCRVVNITTKIWAMIRFDGRYRWLSLRLHILFYVANQIYWSILWPNNLSLVCGPLDFKIKSLTDVGLQIFKLIISDDRVTDLHSSTSRVGGRVAIVSNAVQLSLRLIPPTVPDKIHIRRKFDSFLQWSILSGAD